ncbi:MAG: glutamyl-tRNA reductase [Acidobacteriota bacterium]|nr:glutamyl-tRNA reductase [Blastocatellia bacterium]MDW8411957.1 glutamyl-tRNA reductase [Acidobacteriota bacterium]
MILLVGLNHRTAPVEVREKLAFHEAGIKEALLRLVDHNTIDEAMIVSTCNRVEILACSRSTANSAVEHICNFLSDFHKFHPLPKEYLYKYVDRCAIHHVFRVTASLDSMVVGEPQILGQVKQAFSKAQAAGTIGRLLNRLMSRAFSVAKKVRSQTLIGSAATSISSAAVELIKTVFDNLASKTVLLLGAGCMAEAAAKHLVEEGVKNFIVCNRTLENAAQLATSFGAQAADFSQLLSLLPKADILICSTGADSYVLTYEDCKGLVEKRRYRPIFLIDISVPRNLDPNIAKLENHFVFDIDDLQQAVDSNLQQRHLEASKAERIVEAEVELFLQSFDGIDVGPTITALRRHLADVVEAELLRVRNKLQLSPEQESAIRSHLLTPLVSKLLHPLTVVIREGIRQGSDPRHIIDLYHKAYKLDTKPEIEE